MKIHILIILLQLVRESWDDEVFIYIPPTQVFI